jgi:multisubunit Na+/H+ antiporter MnhB subunit
MTALASPLHATVLNYIAEGRGEDPSGAGGVLLVVGIALAVLLIAGSALYLVSRSFRTRRAKNQSAETVERPLPSEQGRPWSSER